MNKSLDSMPQVQSLEKTGETKDRQPYFNVLGLSLSLVLIFSFCFFMRQPLSDAGSDDAAPRGAIFLQPLFNPHFVDEIWFGVDLPKAPFTGERLIAFFLGALAVLGATAFGRVLFACFRRALNPTKGETLFFSGTLGLTALSTYFLALGLCGQANRSVLPLFAVGLVLGFCQLACAYFRRAKSADKGEEGEERPNVEPKRKKFLRLGLLPYAGLALFVSFYLLAATQPIFEYDALEYHVQGAREIYESGKIGFVPHNVYANMPLGVEQYYVAGFNLARDLGYRGQDVLRVGSLIGKTILSSLALLTVLGLLCFCRRFFPNVPYSGVFAALFYLSIPGVFDVFSNGLNEGAIGLAILSLAYGLLLSLRNPNGGSLPASIFFGCLTGLAISTKYTAVVFVFLPFALILSLALRWKKDSYLKTLACLALFVATTALVGGGWYARNLASTGNPVYPLGYSVFGDSTGQWNDEIDARWKKAHASSEFGAKAALDASKRVMWGEVLSSPFFVAVPLVFAISIFSFVRSKRRTTRLNETDLLCCSLVFLALLYALGWHFATHRLTRFLLPITPVVAIAVGVYASRGIFSRSTLLKATISVLSILALLYSGLIIDIVGQGRMAPLRALERDPMRFPPAAIFFNDRPEVLQTDGDEATVHNLILVGDAKAAAFRVPVLYSTCWNDSPIMQALDQGVARNDGGEIVRIEDPATVRAALRKLGASFVYVDFGELARFTSEGNYGINNPELNANLFMLLEQSGVITPYVPEGFQELGETSSLQRIYKVCEN